MASKIMIGVKMVGSRKIKKSAVLCKLVLVLAAILIIMTSRSGEPGNTSEELKANGSLETHAQPVNTPAAVSSTTELINVLDEIFLSGEKRNLNIEKKGDKMSYQATELLNNTISDMLQKSERLDTSSIEEAHINPVNYYQRYDYILKFEGAKDILLSLDDNTFHMEGESEVFKLWGDSRSFWESLKADDSTGNIDLSDKSFESMVQLYQEDIDGDGKTEDVSLVFVKGKANASNDRLIIKADDAQTVVADKIEWITVPYHVMNEPPRLEFFPKPKGKVLVVTYSWATNGVGSTGVAAAFGFENGKFSSLEIVKPQIELSYFDTNIVKISYPQLNTSQTLNVADGIESSLESTGENLKDVVESGFIVHTLEYGIMDFDEDGQDELYSIDLLEFQAITQYYLDRIYTFYEIDNGRLVPRLCKVENITF